MKLSGYLSAVVKGRGCVPVRNSVDVTSSRSAQGGGIGSIQASPAKTLVQAVKKSRCLEHSCVPTA